MAIVSIGGGSSSVLDAYPVGSIYMSVNQTSPDTLFGGTWERITGRFLLSATDNGSSGAAQAAGNTGGEASHTLTTNEMPSHTHTQNSHSHTVPKHGHGFTNPTVTLPDHQHGNTNGNYMVYNASLDQSRTAFAAGNYHRASVANTGSPTSYPNCGVSGGGVWDKDAFSTEETTATNQNAGGGQVHNNMPPYLSVYMWKRTA